MLIGCGGFPIWLVRLGARSPCCGRDTGLVVFPATTATHGPRRLQCASNRSARRCGPVSYRQVMPFLRAIRACDAVKQRQHVDLQLVGLAIISSTKLEARNRESDRPVPASVGFRCFEQLLQRVDKTGVSRLPGIRSGRTKGASTLRHALPPIDRRCGSGRAKDDRPIVASGACPAVSAARRASESARGSSLRAVRRCRLVFQELCDQLVQAKVQCPVHRAAAVVGLEFRISASGHEPLRHSGVARGTDEAD